MTYRAVLERLAHLARFGVNPGLQRVTEALSRLGDPHQRFASIHLAGTNGKGSTAALLASCLRAQGRRVGLYTSPHLCRFTERILVSGEEISHVDLARVAERVFALDLPLTFFEVATVIAFTHFAEQGVELAVVETGLGGRLDATNVLSPLVAVLTHIDLDHQDLLGADLPAIAREKAGIIKPGVLTIAAPAAFAVEEVLVHRCEQQGARLWIADQDFHLRREPAGLVYTGQGVLLEGLRLSLLGDHQRENAALCLASLCALDRRGFPIHWEKVALALATASWPGRLEWIGDHLLDGAHNPCGARALAAALDPGIRYCLIFGLLGVREVAEILRPLLPLSSRVIFTAPRSPRAVDPRILLAHAPGSAAAPRLTDALELAVDSPGPRLITGSLYLVGEARALLGGEIMDPLAAQDPLPGRLSLSR